MATTPQGAIELQKKVLEIRRSLKQVADAAQTGYNLAERIALGDDSDLGFRIRKGEAPKAEEIPPLQATLAGLKTNIEALASAIEVPSVEDFTALAETPDPS